MSVGDHTPRRLSTSQDGDEQSPADSVRNLFGSANNLLPAFFLSARRIARWGALARATDRRAAERATARLLGAARTGLIEASHAALVELVTVWALLSDSARERLSDINRGAWASAVQTVLADESRTSADRIAALGLIADLAGEELIELLSEALGDSDESVARAAGLALARHAADAPEAALVAGLARYDLHRQRDILVAATRLLDTPAQIRRAGPELILWLAEASHPAHMPMRSLLRRTTGVAARVRSWTLLPFVSLRSACLDQLSETPTVAEHEGVLRRWQLVLNPRRRAALYRLGVESGESSGAGIGVGGGGRGRECVASALLPDAALMAGFSVPARRHIARMASEIGDPQLLARLEPSLGDPDATVRLAAVRSLSCAEAISTALADACFDPDARVAEAAARAVLVFRRDEYAGLINAETLLRSPHAGVRNIAATCGIGSLTTGEESEQRRAVRRLHAAHPATLLDQVRTRLNGPSADHRAWALRAARWAGIEARLEIELLATLRRIGEAEPKAASAIVRALGSCASASAQQAVRRCLAHADGRTRASAIESLFRRAHGSGPVEVNALATEVAPMLNDTNHRARAAAARATILSQNASADAVRRALMPMLEDTRPPHRVAGLWLLQRTLPPGEGLAWDGLPGLVAGLVSKDPDPAVRARARRCADAMLRRVRSGWSERAGKLTSV